MKEERICKKCNKTKLVEEFPKEKTYRRYTCKTCRAKQDRTRFKRPGMTERRMENKRKWNYRNRFKAALGDNGKKAKKLGYVSCIASIEEIKAAYTGKCHACGASEIELNRRPAMDHCHRTGMFRGWLCRNCNLAAGHLKDSPEIMRNLADYIENAEASV